MGHDVYAGGFGGATLLASLGALEALRAGSPSVSAPDLERLVRIANEARDARVVRSLAKRGLGADADGEARVADAAQAIAARVRSGEAAAGAPVGAGAHSSAVVVVDAEGDVVAGTHTIEGPSWGEGLFVGGVPLATAAHIEFDDARAATSTMRPDPLSDTIVIEDGSPRAALAVYGTGLYPGDLQVLDALLARGLSPEEAVLEPRVGYFAGNLERGGLDPARRVVDPRFDRDLLCALREHGLRLERSMREAWPGFVDTGFPTLVAIGRPSSSARLEGMTPDAPHIHGVAAGDPR
jgi:gamma-glutamyltranspeptidase/glutathione hydrolase